MNSKIFISFLILVFIAFPGCIEKTQKETFDYKAFIGFSTYIDRVEPDGQRTIVIIVSPTATKDQVSDLADFLIRDSKENRIWIEVWDDLTTLQKGSGITEADKVAHYILHVRADKLSNKIEYYWERKYK